MSLSRRSLLGFLAAAPVAAMIPLSPYPIFRRWACQMEATWDLDNPPLVAVTEPIEGISHIGGLVFYHFPFPLAKGDAFTGAGNGGFPRHVIVRERPDGTEFELIDITDERYFLFFRDGREYVGVS